MSNIERVIPQVVPAGTQVNPDEPHPLDPCPVCNASPDNSPEVASGTLLGRAEDWMRLHCWKCGYRPEQDVSKVTQEEAAFRAFKEWYSSDKGAGRALAHPSVSTDNRPEGEPVPVTQVGDEPPVQSDGNG